MATFITGASGGLGLQFARIAASRGENLVLTARSAQRLGAIQKTFEAAYGVRVTVLPCDLSRPGAAEALIRKTEAQGLVVDTLILNAGSGRFGALHEMGAEALAGLLELNMASAAQLARFFAGDMAGRGGGKVLFVSSVVAFQPDPWFNVYAPAKAFLLSLGLAMAGELAGTGVSVTVLCPGPTRTGWCRNAGKRDVAFAAHPYPVALAGYKGLQRGALIVLPGLAAKAGRAAAALPARWMTAAAGRWQRRLAVPQKEGAPCPR